MNKQTAPNFVRWLKSTMDDAVDSKFVWFLGAGCSISSGIKSAETLAQDWLTKLKANEGAHKVPLEDWVKRRHPQFSGSYGPLYGEAMRALYPKALFRQDVVEKLTANKQPGFGYAVLAQLLSQPLYGAKTNVVLTTNFDDLLADALYLYAGQRPRVFAHESLVNFVRTTSSRPLVIKLHGDSHIGAKNTKEELCSLAESVEKLLGQLLHERGLIFLGYGGHDESITKALRALPKDSLPGGVYWVRSSVPDTDLGKWLEERDATWVDHKDFDLFMLYLLDAFNLEHPTDKPFTDLMQNYRRRFEELKSKVANTTAPSEVKVALGSALKSAEAKITDVMAVEAEAKRLYGTDPAQADAVYLRAMEKYPDSAKLLSRYATFLYRSERSKEAEAYYLRALEIDPDDTGTLTTFALFLDLAGREQEAEPYYRRAIDLSPDRSSTLANYADMLLKIGRRDEAEPLFRRALEIDPFDVTAKYGYAKLLEKRERRAKRPSSPVPPSVDEGLEGT